jgi:hypothetical protein
MTNLRAVKRLRASPIDNVQHAQETGALKIIGHQKVVLHHLCSFRST